MLYFIQFIIVLNPVRFQIHDHFAGQNIHIHAYQLPIINQQLFEGITTNNTLPLQILFATTQQTLKTVINRLLNGL